ncbi:hypothetical protein DL546_005411, partial [Coniochaeta pulveracea]
PPPPLPDPALPQEELNGEREEPFMCRRPTRRMRRKRTQGEEGKRAGREGRRRSPPREGWVDARWVGAGGCCKGCLSEWWVVREPGLEAVVEEE